jgi:hypothetical protein
MRILDSLRRLLEAGQWASTGPESSSGESKFHPIMRRAQAGLSAIAIAFGDCSEELLSVQLPVCEVPLRLPEKRWKGTLKGE